MEPPVSSPASTGPAGAQFEGQVGAAYLLAILTNAPPRGLPGTVIDRVQFQRAAEGHPLDDVIVHAHDNRGQPAVLEIQVKRSLTAAPSDPEFAAAVMQARKAAARTEFWQHHHELAVAFARPSRALLGAYPDVLSCARQLGSAKEFFERLGRRGAANDTMRTFVNTVRNHLSAPGTAPDDEHLWRLLQRFQLLMFDFATLGSDAEMVAVERCGLALHEHDRGRSRALWGNLIELAVDTAARGGELTRERLRAELINRGFRLAGDRALAQTRAVLAEATALALGDIHDQIGTVQLLRNEALAAARVARESARFVEIRGEGGVGKSALLKHVAEQIGRESPVLLCSPGRIPEGGALALREQWQFDGTLRELLLDLASAGGAVLLIDGVENFTERERITVSDLLKTAAEVPGFAVLITTRHSKEGEEHAWLPSTALDSLGRSAPVVIGDLTDQERADLAAADPKLAPLLNNEAAKEITGNLYRLARLAQRPAHEQLPRTEIDLADQWWDSADGNSGTARRERARVLGALADQALARAEPLSTHGLNADAIEALIRSGSLRDLKYDRVAFQHDILRDWAVAERLSSDLALLDRLPLTTPASPGLARSVELAGRRALERSADDDAWRGILERMSAPDVHGSWRRAVVLGLVRSEIGTDLLKRAEKTLLANDGALARELIRTVMAIEVEPASFRRLADVPESVPTRHNLPLIHSWWRLLGWLLGLGERFPNALIPVVTELFIDWPAGTGDRQLATPTMVECFYDWLTEIEDARYGEYSRNWREPFAGKVRSEELRSVESRLRAGLALYADIRPEVARQYLLRLMERARYDNANVLEVLRFGGSFSRAAPAELSELTARALIAPVESDATERPVREPFTYIDHQFVEASPSQGPFLALLRASPTHGLALIRRLIDHAVAFYTGGKPPGTNGLLLPLTSGERTFPWALSYFWARESGGHNCLTSALMALEAWGHERLGSGEPVETVLRDVFGEPGAPAAYVMVAVDLVLSCWPASADAAIPFLSNPELLCLDRERQIRDGLQPQQGADGAWHVPRGFPVPLSALQSRPSRRRSLIALLGEYAHGRARAFREALAGKVQSAAARLGPPGLDADWSDPAFVAAHAVNALDLHNYREVEVQVQDGNIVQAWRYEPPETEARQFKAMTEVSRELQQSLAIELAVDRALDDSRHSSPELAARAVVWAQRLEGAPATAESDRNWIRAHSGRLAALLAMRDGTADLRNQQEAWARVQFMMVFTRPPEGSADVPNTLRFNPIAISLVGFAHLLKHRPDRYDLEQMLLIAGRFSRAGAPGFSRIAAELAELDERWVRSLLRSAFMGSIAPIVDWNQPKSVQASARAEYQRRRGVAVEGELQWLAGHEPEPAWPTIPNPPMRRTHWASVDFEQEAAEPVAPTERFDDPAAGAWLYALTEVANVGSKPWVAELLEHYAPWTLLASGASLRQGMELTNRPRWWGEAYYRLLARVAVTANDADIARWILRVVTSLPDEPFFNGSAAFIHELDYLYLENKASASRMLLLRNACAQRLMGSRAWRELRGSRSDRIEMHLGPAVARLFFNLYQGFAQPPAVYVLPQGIAKLAPFWTLLVELVRSAPSFWVALFALDLLKVAPNFEHLPIVVNVWTALMESFADDEAFWRDYDFGRRFCEVLELIYLQDSAGIRIHTLRPDIDRLLAILVRLGIADAARMERLLADQGLKS